MDDDNVQAQLDQVLTNIEGLLLCPCAVVHHLSSSKNGGNHVKFGRHFHFEVAWVGEEGCVNVVKSV